ncbi:nucleotide sugar dehydrogenase [Actinoplanes sp. NPDC049599]|uniref:nucleotide sugar dehydrogenase n=1 Tax=Actinoplanes sp. NPDC049599 TaxID=3363903 RepID=UPI0037AFBCA9
MIKNAHLTVVVIGQGYVGLPVAEAAVAAGHQVVGYDIDTDKVARINAGSSPIEDVDDAGLAAMLASGRYRAVTEGADLRGFDIALVTVPTPLADGRPDLSAVLSAARLIAPHVTAGCTVVLESTVAPGTTAGAFAREIAQGAGSLSAAAGDYHLGFSPERIDPGNTRWRFGSTPKLVSGTTEAGCAAVAAFYRTVCEVVVPCSSPDVAEMAKLLENTYRHVNIALVNEMSRHAHLLGIPIWDVVEAAATKPYGFQAFYPGPGVGGHCLPVDPVYLADRVESEVGRRFDFVDLAMRVNDEQPDYVVDRAMHLLNGRKQSVNGASVLVLGISYKANTGDMRETPAHRIVERLRELGAAVSICDPYAFPAPDGLRDQWSDVKIEQLGDVATGAARADLTILVTDHDNLPYEDIARNAGLILDTRNRFPRAGNVHRL